MSVKEDAKWYAQHSALNLGQAARDVRYLGNHPHADKVAPEGSAKHIAASIVSRIPSLAGNLYYAALPPQLHHSREELKEMGDASLKQMFLRGYAPWKYASMRDELEKIAAVIGHIGGASGSGKTTLLSQARRQYPGLVTKDLDDFDNQAERQLGWASVRKNDYTDKMLGTLASKRQILMDGFLEKNKDKPVLLGGHHTEAGHVLGIPTDNKMMLNTGPLRSAWRGYRRDEQRKLHELPSDYREARDTLKELKGLGYRAMSSSAIMMRIGANLEAIQG